MTDLPSIPHKRNRKEFIVGVALQLNDKDTFTCTAPLRHGDVFQSMKAYGVNLEHLKNKIEQGFITSLGRFLTRYQAMLLVKENKQYEGSFDPFGRDELYSEDLW